MTCLPLIRVVTDLTTHRFVFMLLHPNNDLCLPCSTVGTAPVLTWTLQISLWQKRQRETWMDSARCGVCMKSGNKALQKRPSRTGSHSGRGLWPLKVFQSVLQNTASRLLRIKFTKCQFFSFNWYNQAFIFQFCLACVLCCLEFGIWFYLLLVSLLIVIIDRTSY